MPGRGWLQGRWIGLAATVGVTYAAGALTASAQSPQPGAPPSPRLMPTLASDVKAAHDAFERRQRELRSLAAQAERRASRTAFVGLSARDSLRVAARKHESFVGAPAHKGLQDTPDERIVEYLSDTSAVVAGSKFEGGRAMVVSTSPLVTEEGEPVDLTLVDSGAVATPEHPLVPLRIAEEGPAGFNLPEHGLRVVAGGGGEAVRSDGVVLRAGAGGLDTDVVTRPSTDGAEVGWVLRSARSPEELTMRLDLPTGAVLREVDRGYAVEQDGKVLAAVTPPVAFDAEGSLVELDVSLELDAIRIGIAHRDADIAYPLLVDPEVVVFGTSQFPTPGQEVPHLSQWNNWYHYDYTAPTQPVVDVTAWVGSWGGNPAHRRSFWLDAPFAYYGPNQYATWEYDPPGNAMISGVSFHDMAWFYSAGICSYGGVGGPNNLWTTTNWLWCHQYHSQSWAINVPPHPDNRIVTGFHTAGGPAHRWMYYTINEIRVHLEDDGPAPVVQLDVPSGWTNDPNASITATATDNGLGIKSLSIDGPAGWTAPYKPATQTNTCAVGPCPRSTTLIGSVGSAPGGIPDGEQTVTATATSPGAQPAQASAIVRVDREAPSVTVTGLQDDGYYSFGDHVVTIGATDGAPSSPSTRRSGVARVQVFVDGGAAADTGVVACTAPEASCPRTLSWTYDPADFSPGEQEITIVVADGAGNVKTQVLEVATPGDRFWPAQDDVWPVDGEGSIGALAPPADRRDQVVWGLADNKPKVWAASNDRLEALHVPAARITFEYSAASLAFAGGNGTLNCPSGMTEEQCFNMDVNPAPSDGGSRSPAGRLRRLDKLMSRLCPLQGGARQCKYDVLLAFEPGRVACRKDVPENDPLRCPPEDVRVTRGSDQDGWVYMDTPETLQYRESVRRMLWRYPFVRRFTAWNEPNAQGFLARKPRAAADYYNALIDVCAEETDDPEQPRCATIAGGDVLDYGIGSVEALTGWQNLDGSPNMNDANGDPLPAETYLERYQRYLEQPVQVWGIHAYETMMELKPRRLQRLLAQTGGAAGAPVWLTEVGPIYRLNGAPTTDHYPGNTGARRGARAVQLLTSNPDAIEEVGPPPVPSYGLVNTFMRIDRVYLYQWRGDENWDTGLIDYTTKDRRDVYFCYRFTTWPSRPQGAPSRAEDRAICNGEMASRP